MTAAVGGHRKSFDGYLEGWEVEGRGIECAVADFMALIRSTALALHHDDYDVRIGIEWRGEHPLNILTVNGFGLLYDGVSTPLGAFTAVLSTVTASSANGGFHRQVHELAEDCVNQGGVTNLHVINPVPTDD